MRFEYNRKIVVLGVLLLVLGGSVWLFKAFKEHMMEKFSGQSLPAAVQVTVEPAQEILWAPHIETLGSIRSAQSVDLMSEVSGRVTGIFFRSGQTIEKGALLVQLNPDILNAELESARAAYEFLRVNHERQEELYRRNVGQKQMVDSARADRDAAEAKINQIQAELNQLSIKAPFKGVLGLRYVDIGQTVSPGTLLVNLQAVDSMEVDFTVPEKMIASLTVGLPVSVVSSAYPDSLINVRQYILLH
jgi:membrane fusion protein (multidrug efflux system)